MLVNSDIAKILYNRNININSEWLYSEALEDIKLNDRDCNCVNYKKGEVNLTIDWGRNAAHWKEENACQTRYLMYSAPEIMDVICHLIENNINLCVVYVNGKLTWQVTDMDNNVVYQNTDTIYSRKYKSEDTPEELLDYESELQDGLVKAVDILIERQCKK